MTGSQLELMLEKNEAKAQELTLTWIDKWKRMEINTPSIDMENPILVENESSCGVGVGVGVVSLSSSSSAVCSSSNGSKKFSSGYIETPPPLLYESADLPYLSLLNDNIDEDNDSTAHVYLIRPGETVLGSDEAESNIGELTNENTIIVYFLLK